MKILINAGADVNAIDLNNNTPLMHASLGSCIVCIKLLLRSGALINKRNIDNHNALELSIIQKRPVD